MKARLTFALVVLPIDDNIYLSSGILIKNSIRITNELIMECNYLSQSIEIVINSLLNVMTENMLSFNY